MPRELVARSAEDLELVEYEDPPLQPGEVRVLTEYAAAKHGTESSMVKGYAAERGGWDPELHIHDKTQPGWTGSGPIPVGNMFVGRDDGGRRILGYGPFRETHTLGEGRGWLVPDDVDWRSAVCLDPADFAMAAVRDGNVRVGDAVALFGMGAIGLMAVQLAKISGASPVIAVDPLPIRRAAARASGADLTIDPTGQDAGREIKIATDRRGADVVVEYSGSVHALQAALRGVAFGGTVVCGAFPPPYGPGLDLGAEAHLNIPNIVFSRACSEPNREHPRWNEPRIYATCWRLICEGRLRGERVVDPVVSFDELPAAYAKVMTDPSSSVKLGAYV